MSPTRPSRGRRGICTRPTGAQVCAADEPVAFRPRERAARRGSIPNPGVDVSPAGRRALQVTVSAPVDSGLADKRVLVTGASGGIGAACAEAFAAEGARVFVHYHRGRDRAEAV